MSEEEEDGGRRMGASNRVAQRLHATGRVVWPIVGVLILAWVAIQVLTRVSAIVIALGVALLVAALLQPGIAWLQRHGTPKWLATVLVLIGAIVFIGGIITFTVRSLISGLGDLRQKLIGAINALQEWLITGPLNLSRQQLNSLVQSVINWIQNSVQVASAAFTVVAVLAGIALVIFVLVFFLYDGNRMWQFLIRAVPDDVRPRADRAGHAAFNALGSYVLGTIVVALVDTILIGIGLAIIGVPLVFPLAALIFIGAFIPFIGATVSGVLAVLVALVSGGFVEALLVAGLVVGVQFVEGNILQPLIIGGAVRLHPVAVILAVSVGLTVWGIAGALLAVPIMVVIRELIRTQ